MTYDYMNTSFFHGIVRYSEAYSLLHGYLSLIICIFGITSNLFNIIVLTRKHMITSTNVILTALAISDLITMIAYVPTSLKYYCLLERIDECHDTYEPTFFWNLYALIYTNLTVTMHSISIWLTVLLAFFRYLYICHNTIGKRVCKMKNTILSIIFVIILSTLLCFPSYLVSKINKVTHYSNNTLNGTITYYELAQSNLDRSTNSLIFRITFISQAIGIKLIPCFLIIILSALLIRSIHLAKQTNKRLQQLGRKNESEKSKEHTRTNIMLVLVCALFFITEFPQGILALLSIIFEKYDFHANVYAKFGDTMDILALFNNSVNFILYCSMSRVFRKTFKDLFIRMICCARNLKGKFKKRRRKQSYNGSLQTKRVNDVESQPLR